MNELSPSVRFARAIDLKMAGGRSYIDAYFQVKREEPDLFEAADREGKIAAANEATRRRPVSISVTQEQAPGVKAILKTVHEHMEKTGRSFPDAFTACRRLRLF